MLSSLMARLIISDSSKTRAVFTYLFDGVQYPARWPRRASQTAPHTASRKFDRNLRFSAGRSANHADQSIDPPSSLRVLSSKPSGGIRSSSLSRSPTVGTVSGSKLSTSDGLIGTQIRPDLVLEYTLRVTMDKIRRLTGTRMNAEWRFQQVIPVFRHFRIDSWVSILQDDIF